MGKVYFRFQTLERNCWILEHFWCTIIAWKWHIYILKNELVYPEAHDTRMQNWFSIVQHFVYQYLELKVHFNPVGADQLLNVDSNQRWASTFLNHPQWWYLVEKWVENVTMINQKSTSQPQLNQQLTKFKVEISMLKSGWKVVDFSLIWGWEVDFWLFIVTLSTHFSTKYQSSYLVEKFTWAQCVLWKKSKNLTPMAYYGNTLVRSSWWCSLVNCWRNLTCSWW